MEEKTSYGWRINERVVRTNYVIFEDRISEEEALQRFSEGDYYDIVDYSDNQEEVWDTAEPFETDDD